MVTDKNGSTYGWDWILDIVICMLRCNVNTEAVHFHDLITHSRNVRVKWKKMEGTEAQ
jgi:hypothetical protein